MLLGTLQLAFAGAKMKETESIFGRNVLFIKAAMPEIEKQKLKLELYRVSLFEDTDSVTVLLIDKEIPASDRKARARDRHDRVVGETKRSPGH